MDVETLASKIAQDQALAELDATGWIIRLAKALEPIHALGVAHGNITAEAVRVAAAGRASRGVLAEAGRLRELPAYHSPERLAAGEGPSIEDDTWAVGVTLYLALTGSLPFPGASAAEVKRRIQRAPPAPLAVFDVGDDGLQHVLDQAFARDLASRVVSLRELREALEEWHPDGDVKKLPPLDDDSGDDSLDAPPSLTAQPVPSPRASRPRSHAQPPVPRPQATESMALSGLLPASDEEDGPTQVRGPSSVQQYLAALQEPAAPGPTAQVPAAPAMTAQATAPLTERGSRLRRLPAPMAPPLKQSPSTAPGAMPAAALAPVESPSSEHAGQSEEGPLDDDDEPTMFGPSMLARAANLAGITGQSPAAVIATPAPVIAMPAPAPMFPAPLPVITSSPASSRTAAPEVASDALSNAATVVPSNASAEAPPPSGEPLGRGRSRTPLAIGAGVLVAGAAAAFFLFGGNKPSGQPASLPALPASSATAMIAPASATITTAPIASASAMPSAAASANASALPVATAGVLASSSPGSVAACLMPLFAPGSFVDPSVNLGSLCAITDPRKGGEAVRIEVILGSTGRASSDGMREWGVLGLYEMAAFAVLRATCCPAAAAIDIPISVPTCDIESPLKTLAEAAALATTSDADLTAAVTAYTTQARCISRAGAQTAFGQKSRLQGGELETFMKTLDRVRAVVKKR